MTDTGAIYLDSHAYPVRIYQRAQANLVFLFCEAESAMGRRSNQGTIEAMLEGARGSYHREDLIGDPEGALERMGSTKRIRAATRARLVAWALAKLPSDEVATLRAVYGPDYQRGMEAWGMLANLVASSSVAAGYHARSRSKADQLSWLVRLSSKVTGQIDPRGNGRIRKRPTATEHEVAVARAIEHDCREKLLPLGGGGPLRNFVIQMPRRNV